METETKKGGATEVARAEEHHSLAFFAGILVIAATIGLYTFTYIVPNISDNNGAATGKSPIVQDANSLVNATSLTNQITLDKNEVLAAVEDEAAGIDPVTKMIGSTKEYLSGGSSNGLNGTLGDLYFFGTSWNPSVSQNNPHPDNSYHNLFYYKGKLWTFGGNYAAVYPSSSNVMYSSLDSHTWTPNTIPWWGSGARTIFYKGFVWAIGGYRTYTAGASASLTNDVSVFDGSSWVNKPTPPWSPRSDVYLAVYQDKLYAIGGQTGPGSNVSNEVWAYDDATKQWTQKTSWPTANYRIGATVSTFNDGTGPKIFILGGKDTAGTYTHDAQFFNGSTWSQKTITGSLWSERIGLSSFVKDGTLYIAGGNTSPTILTHDFWSTTDGSTWNNLTITNPPTWSNRTNAAVSSTPLFYNQKPDLLISNFVINPAIPHESDIANLPYPMLNFYVKNPSKVTAYIPESMVLSIYNGTTLVAHVVYDRETVVKAGQTKNYRGQIKWVTNLPASTPGSPYQLTLKVDDANVLDEYDETNNTYQFSLQVLP